jgi:uncharacterized protein
MILAALTRADIVDSVARIRSEVEHLGVQRLALFGSVQRNAARPDSDVDILVEFRPGEKTYDHFLSLGDLLEAAFGRRVELVTAESLSPFIGPHILAEATDVLRAA